MRTRAWLSALALLLFPACDGTTTPDGGTPLPDAPSGDAFTPDAGSDLGTDLGGDAGPPCVGPPGMYSDMHCAVIAADLRLYAPEFTLWADGASKDRYVYLPPGTKIDATDPDHWVFPMGTRFYKEFGLAGVRYETRVLTKTGPDPGVSSWTLRAYIWNATQDAVVEIPGGMMDILGTDHDVPSRAQCGQCHGPAMDAVLGFSAIQLAHGTGVTLAMLNSEGWLGVQNATMTALDPTTIDPAMAETPGDAVVRPALGYLHANCSHCHHGSGAPAGMQLDVLVGLTRPEDSSAYLTAVRIATTGWHATGITARVEPGMPDASAIPYRMSHRADSAQMPPLGTEHVDDVGLAAVRAWVMGIP